MSTSDHVRAAQSRHLDALTAVTETFMKEYAAEATASAGRLLNLAQSYDRATTDAHRKTLAAEVAAEITLDEAGTIRRAAEAIKLGTPGIIARETTRGTATPVIAKALGVTDSYVRRIVREHRLISWRIDLLDSEAGPGWHPWETGQDVIPTTHTEVHFAERKLAASGRGPREHCARVLIWDGADEQPDTAAVYTHERAKPDTTI